MSLHDNQVPALPREQATPQVAEPETLKLINVGPSADARHVDLHFVTTANRVTSAHLDITVATGLYNLLGDALGRITPNSAALPPTRLN